MRAKKLLDELRWHPSKSLEGVEITYVHRGAPGDVMRIGAEKIIKMEKSFFIIMRNGIKTRIPYHRICEIKKGNKILFKRGP